MLTESVKLLLVVAVMETTPGAMAVTYPLVETVAMLWSDDDQIMLEFAADGDTVAESCTLPPMFNVV